MRTRNIVIIVIVIIVLAGAIYSCFYGTPWGRAIAREEISQYLKDKYSKEMTISSVYYNFKQSGYDAHVYSNEDNIVFIVEPGLNISGYKYRDCYLSSIWQKQIADDIKKSVKIIDNTEIYVSIMSYFTTFVRLTQIPYYKDEMEKIGLLNVYLYNDVDENVNYTQLFEIISVLETKKINYGKVLYSYYQKDKTKKEVEFTQEDAKKINSVKEIERFVNSE